MHLQKQNTALLLVDIQKGFDEEDHWGGNRNNRNAEEKCVEILNTWRTLKLPIYHIVHSSMDPKSKLHESHPGFAIKDEVKPLQGETIIKKQVNSAFIGTALKEQLDEQKITCLVIVGLTTNHCISTTTRMAGNFGYDVLLVSDATATFDRIGVNGEKFSSEIIHQTTLASLNEEFCKVVNSEQLLKLV